MGTWVFMQHDPFNAVYPSNRRSFYLMTQRIQRHPHLAMFDGAYAAISVAQRPLTNTPIQALFFMNSDLLHTTAATWAKQLIDTRSRDDQRVAAAFRTALGRAATVDELARAAQYMAAARKTMNAPGTQAPGRLPRHDPAPAGHRSSPPDIPPRRPRLPADRRGGSGGQADPGVRTLGAKAANHR
jgi:hypothetical protein